MYQKQLPFRLSIVRAALRTALLFFGIVAVVLVAAYAYLTYTKDDLVQYFPAHTVVYASFRADEEVLAMSWYEQLRIDPALKQQLSLLVAHDLTRSSRNIAVGLVPTEGAYETVMVAYLRNPLPPTHQLFTVLQQLNLHSFTIDNAMLRKQYLVITASAPTSELMRQVIQTGDTGLSHNVTLSFARQRIGRDEGVFFAQGSLIDELKYQIPLPAAVIEQLPAAKTLTAELTFAQGMILARSFGYGEGVPVTLPASDELVWGLRMNNFGERLANRIETIPADELAVARERYGFDSELLQGVDDAWYMQYNDDKSLILAKNGDSEALIEPLTGLLGEWLAYDRRKPFTTYLPDGSPIRVITKNRADIAIREGSVIDATSDDRYTIETWDGFAAVMKNMRPDELTDSTELGCLIDPTTDIAVVGTEVLQGMPWLKLFARQAVFSTYPQRYPQFLACIR